MKAFLPVAVIMTLTGAAPTNKLECKLMTVNVIKQRITVIPGEIGQSGIGGQSVKKVTFAIGDKTIIRREGDDPSMISMDQLQMMCDRHPTMTVYFPKFSDLGENQTIVATQVVLKQVAKTESQ